MKYLEQFFVILLFVPMLFSCELEIKPDEQLDITKETLSAKWLVSGTNGIYESFEFDVNGNYIVVEKSSQEPSQKSTNGGKIHAGLYKILGGLELSIVMQDFGILESVIFGPKTGKFTVTKDAEPDNEVTVEVEKDEIMEESVNTTLLSNVWVFSKATVVFAEDGTTIELDNPVGLKLVTAITYYGTYATFKSYKGEKEESYGHWMWIDESETGLFLWNNNESFSDAHRATIVTLSETDLVLSIISPEGNTNTEYYVPEPSGKYW